MSIAKATAKSRWKGVLLAAAAAGALAPAIAAEAGLTVNLQLAPGAGGSTAMYINPTSTTAIPIYVYATVTGSAALTAPYNAGNTSAPATTGDFDGLQFLYYNILNTNSTGAEIAGSVTSATLNPVLGFDGGNPQPNPNPGVVGVGAQTGTLANTAPSGTTPGLSVGSFFNLTSSSTTAQVTAALAGIAKPRSNSPVFQNYSQATTSGGGGTTYNAIGNDGVNIIVNSATSVSFLVETLMYTPTSSNPGAKTTFTVQIPNLSAVNMAGANWFQDNTTLNPGGQPQSTMNGAYASGTQAVIEQTLPGDANLDGKVDFNDLVVVAQNYNHTGTTFATGDFNGSGNTDFNDLVILAQNYNKTLGAITPSELADLDSIGGPSFTDAWAAAQVAAVPEPATLGLLALGAAGALTGRRRNAR